MSGGGRCLRRHRWNRCRWSRRQHEGGAKICDDDDGVECVVKPADVGIQSDAKYSISVRDRRIGWSHLRVNAQGILYVLNSEDEDSGMEVDEDGVGVAAEGATTANGADLSVERPPVSGGGVAGEDLSLGPLVVAPDDASGMDLAPEVAARLKEVLANMDPIYHEVFIGMYKILVPIFFCP
jgi:hypothetical protein